VVVRDVSCERMRADSNRWARESERDHNMKRRRKNNKHIVKSIYYGPKKEA
jgi:hypothetical protein